MSSLEKRALVSLLLSPICSDLTTPITMTFQDTATFQDTGQEKILPASGRGTKPPSQREAQVWVLTETLQARRPFKTQEVVGDDMI